MGLRIKDEHAHALARELASLTGETLTAAVTVALDERLELIRRQREGPLADRLLALGQQASLHIDPAFRSVDVDDLLYDEYGLPK